MAQLSLNRKLTLEDPVKTPDGAGGFSVTWTALGDIFASVQLRSGRERAGNSVSLASVTYKIILRAAPVGAPSRPLPGQRFTDGAQVFEIEAVAEFDARGRYLIAFAKEEVAS